VLVNQVTNSSAASLCSLLSRMPAPEMLRNAPGSWSPKKCSAELSESVPFSWRSRYH